MADNKKMMPLVGLGLLAFFLMGSKKSSAKSSSGTVTGGNIPGPTPSDPGTKDPNKPGTKPPNTDIPHKDVPAVVTEIEKRNAQIVIKAASEVANKALPKEWGTRKGQSDLVWGTNLVFWLTYSVDQLFCPSDPNVKMCSAYYGGSPVPFKLTEDMKPVDGLGYDYWSEVWVRIKNYLKKTYNLSDK